MPVGLITNVLALLLGGLAGSIAGKHISESLKNAMTSIFGICAMAIGIRLIIRMDNLSAVVLATVLGAIAGEALQLEQRVNSLVRNNAVKWIGSAHPDAAFLETFCAVAVLFCCSGSGWYGVLNEGFTGDSSILVTKAILDFFTAVIFAAVLGRLVAALAAPQLIIYLILFALSRLIEPYVTETMINDFTAVGGIIQLSTGMRIAGLKKDIRVINLIPAMVLIFFISALWTRLVP